MGLMKRLLGEDGVAEDGVLDLAELAAEMPRDEGGTRLRVAELTRYDDLGNFTDYAYQGNILVLDFHAFAKDEISVKRMVHDLRKVATDTGGDVAGIGEHLIVVTPHGITVDRNKLRVSKA